MSPGLDFIADLVRAIEARIQDNYTTDRGVNQGIEECLGHLVEKLADIATEEE